MATYRFNNLNGGSDIVDPIITLDPIIRELNPTAMTVSVTVYFSINGDNSKFGLILYDIPIPNLVYNYVGLTNLVMIRLQDYLIP